MLKSLLSLYYEKHVYIKKKKNQESRKDQKTTANKHISTYRGYYQKYLNTTKHNYIPNSSNTGKSFYIFLKNVNSHGDLVICFINYSHATT